MITNEGAKNREDEGEAASQAVQDSGSLLSPVNNRAKPTEAVLTAYTTAARGGDGRRENAFDAAVRAFMACYPEAHRDTAARIVAAIISHQT